MSEEDNQILSSAVFSTFKGIFERALTRPRRQSAPVRIPIAGPRCHYHEPVRHTWSRVEYQNQRVNDIRDSQIGTQLIKHLMNDELDSTVVRATTVLRTPSGNMHSDPPLPHHYAYLPATPWYMMPRDMWGRGGAGGHQHIPRIDYQHVQQMSGRTTGSRTADLGLRLMQGNSYCVMHRLMGSGVAGKLEGYQCKGSPLSHLGLVPSASSFPDNGTNVSIQMCIDCYCDLHTHHDMCKYPWIFQTQPYISFKDLCELIGEDELAAKVAEVYRNHSWFPYHLA